MSAARHDGGFSLVELMVVVVVVGVLASFAYTSYQQYSIRTHRSAAQQLMQSIATRQEEFVMDARRYSASTGELGVVVPSEVSTYYTVTVTANNASAPPSYEVVATPISSKMQNSDGSLTLRSSGERLPSDKWE